jgi:hypothetical protein
MLYVERLPNFVLSKEVAVTVVPLCYTFKLSLILFNDVYCGTNRLKTSQVEQHMLLWNLGLVNCQLRPKLQERSNHLLREATMELFRMVWTRNHMIYCQKFLVHPWLA